jgi:hypothetical protein
MHIFLVNPRIPQYAIECSRLSGDVQPFYAFFREFHTLLNNVSCDDLCKKEELAELSDELILAVAANDENKVGMYLANRDIDVNRLSKVILKKFTAFELFSIQFFRLLVKQPFMWHVKTATTRSSSCCWRAKPTYCSMTVAGALRSIALLAIDVWRWWSCCTRGTTYP